MNRLHGCCAWGRPSTSPLPRSSGRQSKYVRRSLLPRSCAASQGGDLTSRFQKPSIATGLLAHEIVLTPSLTVNAGPRLIRGAAVTGLPLRRSGLETLSCSSQNDWRMPWRGRNSLKCAQTQAAAQGGKPKRRRPQPPCRLLPGKGRDNIGNSKLIPARRTEPVQRFTAAYQPAEV